MAPIAMGTATGPAKLQAVTDLVTKLSNDLEEPSLPPQERNDALEELKIYGRDPKNADPIFTEDGFSMLLRHAFADTSSETSRAALRVIANAMLLKPETRKMFVDHGYPAQACENLKTDSWDSEFLLSRIIFLTTYGTNVDLVDLIEKHHLAAHIIHNLERHVKRLSDKQKERTEPMQEMALGETLKLLFNVTHFCKEKVSTFTSAVPPIAVLLQKYDISSAKPLDPPFGPLINSLLNLEVQDDQCRKAFYPDDEPARVTSRLVDLLDRGLSAYDGNDLEALVTPLVGLLSRLYEDAPPAVRQDISGSLLPTAQDREDVLGQGDSLPSRLLQNSTNPMAPALREAISHLLFDMSDRDASQFVENVGYGFASGFLFQNNIPVPPSASAALSKGDITGTSKPVNPITGQFLDREKILNEPEMTEEEKEREAERLFVLFERLKKTGIVDIQNPVEQAVQEGRFEELPDDYTEEVD